MARTKTPPKKTESKSPQQTIAEFARDILMFGTIDRRPTFWDLLAEALLIKVLPDGPQAALEKIRSMRAAPQEHGEELAGFPSEPKNLDWRPCTSRRGIGWAPQESRNMDSEARGRGVVSRKATALPEFL